MARTDGNIIVGTSVDVGGINEGLSSIEKSFKRLAGVAVLSLIGTQLFNLGRTAISAASDLQEVQNIVDVTFGEMSYKIEEFAQHAISSFGMSEYSAKNMAGSFMAMGKAAGISAENASTMAVNLTGLAGDMASFYNISHDYARVALSAVYTGETETLKRYGIILTQANLQQYALSKGITANVKTMNAQQKTMLRYQYIVETLGSDGIGIMGDFERTSMNWANQVRMLQENFRQLLITIGDGLISFFNPMLDVLNKVIAKLMVFVKILYSILAAMGVKFNKAAAGTAEASKTMADGTNEAADSMDNLANGTNKAAKAAMKALQPFDELNNLTTPKSSSGGGGSGSGGSADLSDINVDSLFNFDDLAEQLVPDIRSFYNFGHYVGDAISNALASIDWDSNAEKIKIVGTSLATFLNGLISTEMFAQVGRTIASALNTAIYLALSFGQTFDFTQLGQKIADGVNNFFATFDFQSLAATLNTWVDGIWDLIVAFAEELDYKAIFNGIKDFFSTLNPSTFYAIAGFAVLKTLLGTALSMAFSGALSASIGNLMLTFIKDMAAGPVVTAFVAGLKLLFTGGAATAAESALTFIGPLYTVFAGVISIISGAILYVRKFVDQFQNGFSVVKSILMGVGAVIVAVGAIILGAPAAVAAAVAGIVFAISELVIIIKEHWEEIRDFTVELIETVIAVLDQAIEGVRLVIDGLKDVFKQRWEDIKRVWNECKGFFSNIGTSIKNTFETVVNTIKTAFTNAYNTVKSTWDGIKSFFSGIGTSIYNSIKGAIDKVKTTANSLGTAISSAFKTAFNGAISIVERAINKIVSGVNTLLSPINSIISKGASILGKSQSTFVKLSSVSIPRLANGAVIPPNNEFLAVLGDQKKGTNIEAPLDTIKQAFADALNEAGVAGTQSVNIYLEGDAQGLFKLIRTQDKQFRNINGHSAFSY